MAFWDFFTASKTATETAKNVVDGAIAGIDKAFYTPEEKADNMVKRMELFQQGYSIWLEAQKVLVNETTPRSITRRVLAILILASFLVLVLAAGVAFIFVPLWAEWLIKCSGYLKGLAMTVGVFYFGYYAVDNIVSAVKK